IHAPPPLPVLRHHLSTCATLILLSARFFFFTAPPAPKTYTLSLHDALPILTTLRASSVSGSREARSRTNSIASIAPSPRTSPMRSEEHTSELQSRSDLVCRLLLEKKKQQVDERVQAEVDAFVPRVFLRLGVG